MSRPIGCVVLLLLGMSGCTISVQPWTKPMMPATEGPPPGMVPAGFQGPMPRPLPGPPPVSNDVMMQMNKQLNEADDHRRALLEQVQVLKRQLKEREDNLRLASHEMEDSSTKLRRTREEFKQWESEMTELRERVRKLEDNRRAVAQVLEEVLNHLERPREPLRLPSMDRPLRPPM